MEKAAQAASDTQSAAESITTSQRTAAAAATSQPIAKSQPITKMAVDHNLLVLGYADGSLNMWDLTNCAEIRHLWPPSEYYLAASPLAQPLIFLSILDADTIMAVYHNNAVRLYDRNSPDFIELTLPIGNTQPCCVYQIKKGIVAIGCEDGAIHIYDYISKSLIKTIPAKEHCFPVKLHIIPQGLLQVIYSNGTSEDWCISELQ